MAVLIDTDVAIELMRGNTYSLKCLEECEEGVFLSSITVAELYFGAYHSQRAEQNVQIVKRFIAEFPRLTLTDTTGQIFGEMKHDLRTKSTPVDAFDMLIAALAIENKCEIATGNIKHFSKIEGLKLVDWCRF